MDGVWVMSLAFASTFVLALAAFVCKISLKGFNNDPQANKAGQEAFAGGNTNTNGRSLTQTEMYLVGRGRPAVYHGNQPASAGHNSPGCDGHQHPRSPGPSLLSKAPQTMKARTTTTTRDEPYDLLIIDQILDGYQGSESVDSSKRAILLIEPALLTVNQAEAAGRFPGLETDKPTHYHQIELPEGGSLTGHGGAILRAISSGQQQQLISRQNSSSSLFLASNQLQSSSSVKSPPGWLASSSSPNGYNVELNSQGELTMTDESSSFIHEPETCGGDLRQPICCRPCRFQNDSKPTNPCHQCAHQLPSHGDHPPTLDSACHPPDMHQDEKLNYSASNELGHNTEPTTLKRVPNKRAPDRVRFLDHQMEDRG